MSSRPFVKFFSNNVAYTWGTVSPASDAVPTKWATGDLRFNSDQTSNIVEWKCTAGGTPGTWVPIYGAPSAPVLSVSPGTGISITGTSTAPVVNNTGVLSVSAGAGISVTGTAANPTVNNTGVLSVTAGTGVTVTGTAANPVVNATGTGGTVTDVTASSPLSSSGGTTPNITHDNSGVGAGTYTYSTVTVNATGHVTSASSGTAPVTSVSAGTGISITGTSTAPVVNNTGVTSVSSGYGGIVVTGSGGVTVANGSGCHLMQWGVVFSPITSFVGNPHWIGTGVNDVSVNYPIRNEVHVPAAVGAYSSVQLVYYVNANSLNGDFEIHLIVDGSDSGALATVLSGATGSVALSPFSVSVVNRSVLELKLVDPATGSNVTSGTLDIRANAWGLP